MWFDGEEARRGAEREHRIGSVGEIFQIENGQIIQRAEKTCEQCFNMFDTNFKEGMFKHPFLLLLLLNSSKILKIIRDNFYLI